MTRSPHRKSLALTLAALLLAAGCNPQSCNQWAQVANDLRDTDGDGWFDDNKNQKIDLIVDSIETSVLSGFEEVTFVVDDKIILDKQHLSMQMSISPEVVATTRCAGQWIATGPQQYNARVKVIRANVTSETASVGLLPFQNKAETLTKTLTLDGHDVTFHYRTQLSTFPDPSPQDGDADSDIDGITDKEEARIALDNRIGNPRVRDILVVAAFTRPKWALTKRSVERITTTFLARGFNFLIADERDDLRLLTPGQIMLPDGNNGALVVPAENRQVRISEVAAVRPRHIPDELDQFTHLLIAADGTPDADFGISNGVPGRNVVIRSHLSVLGPDPFGLEYQAKDAMHELGHNFGLCHPNESDNSCPTGSIPSSERNGGTSCMGSPADDGGFFNGPLPNIQAITNAFNRPLNYSPTQWTNIAPQSSRGR